MRGRPANRREFEHLGQLGDGGSCLAPRAGVGSMSLRDAVIDPPVGSAFVEVAAMPVTRPSPGVVAVTVEAMTSKVSVNGTMADLLTYNGHFPGPVIRLKQSEDLALRFVNSLPTNGGINLVGTRRGITNIHTHGWHVSPSGTMDDVRRRFQPGQCGDYLYDLAFQEPGTLCFYHPHIHGLTAEQVWGGLAGPLIVEDATNVLTGYETHVMVLKDIALSSGAPAPYTSSMEYMQGKEGGTVMVNGQVNPVLTMHPGQVQRWRLLNASQARFYKVALAGHTLRVVGTDGGLLDKPYEQPAVLLAPGERLDVLVKATTTRGLHKFLSQPYARVGMMSSPLITLLTVNVAGTAAGDALPATVNPNARRESVDLSTAVHRTFALSLTTASGGKGGLGGTARGLINGQDFDVAPFTVDSEVMPGEPGMRGDPRYEIWTITNQTDMDQPWHQHVNPGQVLAISGGDAGYTALYTLSPAWKDVVIVPKGGSASLLIKVADYTGTCMFHCHVLEHEDVGMMGIWNLGMTM